MLTANNESVIISSSVVLIVVFQMKLGRMVLRGFLYSLVLKENLWDNGRRPDVLTNKALKITQNTVFTKENHAMDSSYLSQPPDSRVINYHGCFIQAFRKPYSK